MADRGKDRPARRFPTFIVDGRERIIGFDPARLDAVLERRLEADQTIASPSGKRE
jgi:hypothetical protein